MLPVLAFLPADDIIEGFKELVDTIRLLYNDVTDDLCCILRTPALVDVGLMYQDSLCFFLPTCGTSSTELMMNYHAPTTT